MIMSIIAKPTGTVNLTSECRASGVQPNQKTPKSIPYLVSRLLASFAVLNLDGVYLAHRALLCTPPPPSRLPPPLPSAFSSLSTIHPAHHFVLI